MLNVQLKRVRPGCIAPSYITPLAAGLDLTACIDEPITVTPGEPSQLIPTGLAAYIGNADYASFIVPRSGLGHKKGLVMGNNIGVIDADYQGELFISVWVRPGHDPVTINPGDRIAQLIFLPIARASFEYVDEFHEASIRGDGGFGSTGVGKFE